MITNELLFKILPEDTIIVNNESQMPSLTYKLDLDKGCIRGRADNVEAVKQSVLKRLLTEKDVFAVYSENYGFGFYDLIGLPWELTESEIERRIRESLLVDDRISLVENFRFSRKGDTVDVVFTVVTIFGESFEAEGSYDYL